MSNPTQPSGTLPIDTWPPVPTTPSTYSLQALNIYPTVNYVAGITPDLTREPQVFQRALQPGENADDFLTYGYNKVVGTTIEYITFGISKGQAALANPIPVAAVGTTLPQNVMDWITNSTPVPVPERPLFDFETYTVGPFGVAITNTNLTATNVGPSTAVETRILNGINALLVSQKLPTV